MHTTSFQGTSFTYNGDLSGPLVIVSKSHSVETTYAAIKEFVSYQEKQIALNALENGSVAPKTPKSLQKIIVSDSFPKFLPEVNSLLEQGWKIIPGTLTIASVSVDKDGHSNGNGYQFRYCVAIEKSS